MENLIKDRIDELVRLVKYYDYMLHIKGKTLISDEKYDALRRELESLEFQYPELVRKDSPSLYIGTISSSCEKIIERKIPMLSLKHTYELPEVLKWIEEMKKMETLIIIEPKIDGVAVDIAYIDGILDSLSLRGNGFSGEDITHFAPYIKNIPLSVESFTGFVRGEVIVPKDKIKTNNRNYVSGALRRKNACDLGLEFFGYRVISPSINTQIESLDFLKKFFECTVFEVLDNRLEVSEQNILEKIDFIRNYDFRFFTDGVVLKINDIALGESLGITHRYPRNALAFKFSENSGESEIIGLDWKMNRRNQLIPVCQIREIILNGSKINRVHGYNRKYLKNHGISIGSQVKIIRVGDVIPQILSVLSKNFEENWLELLEFCPYCKNSISRDENNYFCNNSNCSEVNIQRVLYFFEVLDIDSLSENLLRTHFLKENQNYLQSIEEIILVLNRGNWSSGKVYENISLLWQRKNISLGHFLKSLGIEGVSSVFISNLSLETMAQLEESLNNFYFSGSQSKDFKSKDFKSKDFKSKKNNNFYGFIRDNLSRIKNIYNSLK